MNKLNIPVIVYSHSSYSDVWPLILGQFEVGTEESIRKFDYFELENLLNDLKKSLPVEAFNQIKYLVIQSGTSLKNNQNTGNYDRTRLLNMIKV